MTFILKWYWESFPYYLWDVHQCPAPFSGSVPALNTGRGVGARGTGRQGQTSSGHEHCCNAMLLSCSSSPWYRKGEKEKRLAWFSCYKVWKLSILLNETFVLWKKLVKNLKVVILGNFGLVFLQQQNKILGVGRGSLRKGILLQKTAMSFWVSCWLLPLLWFIKLVLLSIHYFSTCEIVSPMIFKDLRETVQKSTCKGLISQVQFGMMLINLSVTGSSEEAL